MNDIYKAILEVMQERAGIKHQIATHKIYKRKVCIGLHGLHRLYQGMECEIAVVVFIVKNRCKYRKGLGNAHL
jgi:hypothetical protein